MEIQKNKGIPKRLTNIQMGLLLVLVFVIGITISFFKPMDDTQIHQTSLPEDLRATAEFVFDTVQPYENIQLTDDVSVGLYRMQVATSGDSNQTLCLAGYVPVDSNYEEYSRIIVNGEAVSGSFYLAGAGSTLPPRDGDTVFVKCVKGNLETGLHLVEFELRDSSAGEPIATQQWTFEIE